MKLCELMVNQVDGALTMYVQFMSKAFNYCLGLQDKEVGMDEEESKEDIFFEKQTMECAFMQENAEIIIETCMMVYCSLSYAVCKRYDLI